MKHVSVFGLGYVGAVTAACFAHKGNKVLGVDVNPAKVEMIESGRVPVFEPGLDRLIAEGHKARRLHATTDPIAAVSESEISFLCVATPSLPNGRLDLRSVQRSCEEVGKALRLKNEFHWVVLRSTMLPGTAKSLAIPWIEAASGKREGVDFAVCSNPEFTREGCAVADFLNPMITILGAGNPDHLLPLRELYEGISGHIFETSLGVAEMVKYVCNAFHALKISFANEIGTLCRQLDVDEPTVTEIFLSDTRLNTSKAYLTPGFAFGGSCLPKDLRALAYCAKQHDLDLPLLQAIMPSNQAHLERAVEAVLATKRRKIAVLGLSFKPGTDDLRESPSVQLVKRLLGAGCQIQIWDKDVSLGRLIGSNRQFIEEEIPHIGALLATDFEKTIQESEVVVVSKKVSEEIEEILKALAAGKIMIDLSCHPPGFSDAEAMTSHRTSSTQEISLQAYREHLVAAVS
ncbi:MAG TPA: nucleotide sugar dehydrogenase [Terriglobales bacterium]|jgi:GDP-mannose 6-dehydrogenase|nr:nucleotide sugar dehydrogenase [Terriglobales bacterium]